MKRLILTLVVAALVAAPAAWAVNPGMELWVPAVARAEGAQGTHWMTDLTLHNPTTDTVAVDLYFLDRSLTGPTPVMQSIDLAPGQTLQAEDVLATIFGMDHAIGALRITADAAIAATSRIFNNAGGGATYGQGVDAVPTTEALEEGQSTTIFGLSQGSTTRTNVIVLDTTGVGSNLEIALIDAAGLELASTMLELGPWGSMLESVASLFGMDAAADSGLEITTVTGSAVVMASRVDNVSGDPATLSPLMPGRGAVSPTGVYWGTVVDSFIPGGLQMVVNDAAEVSHLNLTFPSNKVGCGYTFPAGGTFSTGVPLNELLETEGLTWFQDYAIDEQTSGRIYWTVKLDEFEANAYASGTVSGVGEGFDGSCDGNMGTFNLHISRPLDD